jgi:hypothetical protein
MVVSNENKYKSNLFLQEYESSDEENIVGKRLISQNSAVFIADYDLSRLFHLYQTIGEKYTIFLCLYSICIESKNPFLKFLVEKNEKNIYHFPSFVYESIQFPDNYQDSDEDDIQENIHFNNSCLEHALKYLDCNFKHDNINFSKLFKGFIEMGNNTFISVFDFSSVNIIARESVKYAIIDEIINKQKVGLFPIDPYISDFLKNKPYMACLKNINNFIIPYPIQMFFCEPEKIVYEPEKIVYEPEKIVYEPEKIVYEPEKVVYDSNDQNTRTDIPQFKLSSEYPNKINHDFFGPVYFFSDKECDHQKRFAIFIDENVLYYDDNMDNSVFFNYSTICFSESDIHYCCVKSDFGFYEI